MQKAFFEVFPELSLNEDTTELMKQASIARVTMNSRKDLMRIYLESDVLIHKKYIFETEQAILDQLHFRAPMTVKIIEKFHLSGQYTAEKLMPIYRDSILLELKNYNHFLFNLFRGAKCEFSGADTLRLIMEDSVLAKGKEEELLAILEKIFCQRCGQNLKIEARLREAKESQNRRFNEIRLQQEVEEISKRLQKNKEPAGDGDEFLEVPNFVKGKTFGGNGGNSREAGKTLDFDDPMPERFFVLFII